MEISFGITKLSSDQVGGCLPVWIAPLLDNSGTTTVVALDGSKLCAMAVYTQPNDREKAMMLQYVYTVEEYRNRNIAGDLLQYAEQVFKDKGFEAVIAKYMGELSNAQRCYEFMIKNKYMPLSLNGHFLMYYLQDMKESAFSGKLEKMQSIIDRVRYYDQVEKKTLNTFLMEARERGYTYDIENIDLLFAGFYMLNGKVEGFMNLEEIVENVLVLNGTYIGKNAGGIAIPAMIAKLMKIAGKVMPEETSILFRLDSETAYLGMKNLFGEPEYDLIMQDYIKKL